MLAIATINDSSKANPEQSPAVLHRIPSQKHISEAHDIEPCLPPEVQDLCILTLADMAFEFVDDRHGPRWQMRDASAKQALKTCLFVSSRMRYCAASRLFHTIDIPGATNLGDALEIREQLGLLNAISAGTSTPGSKPSPLSIGRFVKIIKLQVVDEIYKDVFDDFSILNGFLLDVLSCRPTLKHLTLCGYPGLVWSSFGAEFQRLFSKVVLLPTLVDLTIANIGGIPRSVLCGSTSVTEVLFFLVSTPIDEGENIDPLPALQELTLDAGLDGVVMKRCGTLAITSHQLRKARFNINIEDGFHRVTKVLRSSYESLSDLTIKVPNKIGWNSHHFFTLEPFRNLRNLHFACDIEWDEGPDPLNLATTLYNIASIARTAHSSLATVLLKFKCDLTTIMDAKMLNDLGPWTEIAGILYGLPRKREDSALQVLIHLLIAVDEDLVDVAEGVDEQVLKNAFYQLSTQSKGFYIEVVKQLQVEKC